MNYELLLGVLLGLLSHVVVFELGVRFGFKRGEQVGLYLGIKSKPRWKR